MYSAKTDAQKAVLRLRPHHLIDIITDYGHGRPFEPHPYGHAVHLVARRVTSEPDIELEFVLGADDICAPCCHLQPDGQCDDVLHQLVPPVSKQVYNDELDQRLFKHFGMAPGAHMSLRQFLARVRAATPGLEVLCTHPGESQAARLDGLQRSLEKLGQV